ncbi:MAG: UDP-N-acetylmuramate--L-alanine ligase [Bryobacteraceae bacterium]|nr:UDP-N-acetylmuramate--L-alanine ligase [Bryobacteraceae bacterium]
MFLRPQPVHFTGIGGIGMSGLAEILLRSGFRVSGSDLQRNASTERLAAMGARIEQGHQAEYVGDAAVLVATSAVNAANPEVGEARRRRIPVVSRGELLAELMRPQYGICVAGSHGKTTTTSMIASVLIEAGLDPTVVVGGKLDALGGSNARLGGSEYFVAETDESDGSFLLLHPVIAVITNIDREHVDYYPTMDATRDAFRRFLAKVPFYGAIVACADDDNVREILPQARGRVITYGRSAGAHYQVTGDSSPFRIEGVGTFEVGVPGAHNVLNAAATVAVGLELGVKTEVMQAALARFRGAGRRFERKGEAAGVSVIDDYGHHPTEIAATLEAARGAGFARVHVLFQPHRYTRTQALMEEFAGCFGRADSVYVLDVYAASEPAIPGVTGAALAARIPHAQYAASVPEAVSALVAGARAGDAIITQGAGSVWQAGELLLEALWRRG